MGRHASFDRQFVQVLWTYVTHYWVMAGIAAGAITVASSLAAAASTSRMNPRMAFCLTMPLFFLSLMLVPQAKAQFAHARSRLIPGFCGPHLATLAAILFALLILYPCLVAVCCGFVPLGAVALAVAISASAIWAGHYNRMWGMLLTLAAFYSTFTTAGIEWWLTRAGEHWPAHAAIVLVGFGLLSGWLYRLTTLREEMDDYQNTVQWRASRRAGAEVSEQRRLVAVQFGRSKYACWVSDAWFARLGGYHAESTLQIVRLLRYGYALPAEVQGLFMAVMFAAISIFMAKFSFTAQNKSGLSSLMVVMQMSVIFPGYVTGELLAQRRPRIAVELLRPLTRRRLVDGLLLATAWNWAAMWAVMNGCVVIMIALMVTKSFTPPVVGTLLLLSLTSSFATATVSWRTAVWPSFLKRFAVMMAAMMVGQIPVLVCTLGRQSQADLPFLLVASAAAVVAMVAIGCLFVTSARRAWLNLELG